MNKNNLITIALTLTLASTAANAYEINENFSIGGVLAGAYQCQDVSEVSAFSDTCEGAVLFQPEFSFHPTTSNEIFFKLGFAQGNGLNDTPPFIIPSWGADLEDSVKNINGSDRDYLLAAWYKHMFNFANDQQLAVSLGIIDATDYLNGNAYAEDEYTQFMNTALTNGSSINLVLPAYDLGLALQWDKGPWSLAAIVMDVNENEDGNNFDFYSLQASYHVNNRFGNGNYRIGILAESRDFLTPDGTQLEDRAGLLLSFDQEFGQLIGGWIRFGGQREDAALIYRAIYSGGIDIKGTAWGRGDDNIGLGYAYVEGGNLDIEQSQVAEAYYRWQLGEVFGLTADVQYMQDDYKSGSSLSGWIYGLRAAVEF